MDVSLAVELIRYPFAIVLILAGLDKVLRSNFIVRWEKYISPPAARVIPSQTIFLVLVGLIEIIVGALLFTALYPIISYIGAAWLFIIAINLLFMGERDIAIRDILLGFALLALAQL